MSALGIPWFNWRMAFIADECSVGILVWGSIIGIAMKEYAEIITVA
ncbi:hypothetical protein [Hyphomicrobium sp. DY-1]